MPHFNYAYRYYKLHLKWNRYRKDSLRQIFLKYNGSPIYYINQINRINKNDLYWLTKIQLNVIDHLDVNKHPDGYQQIIKNELQIVSHFANQVEREKLRDVIKTIEPHTVNQVKQCIIALYKQALTCKFLERK